jgi:phosphoglycerate-specific signal transduction histidine kinase
VGYVLDVSAEREAQARALAAARLASIGEMATGLAHEIRQPLQSMSLSAELAQLALRKGDAAGADGRLVAPGIYDER